MGDGVAGSDWTYQMPPGKLVGNYHMVSEERYAALAALETAARAWAVDPVHGEDALWAAVAALPGAPTAR